MSRVNATDWQIKLSPSAISYQRDLSSRSLSAQEKAYRLLGEINSDIESPVNHRYLSNLPPVFAELGYSAQYNVARLRWGRDTSSGTCTAIRGQIGQSAQNYSFTIAEEAEYQIFRNGRLVTKIAGVIETGSAGVFNTPTLPIFGWVNFRILSIPDSVTPNLAISSTDLNWYDLDPYPGPLGTAVRYEIKSRKLGCLGAPLAAGDLLVAGQGPGMSTSTIATFWLDSDGDANPEFIPSTYLATKRAELPGGLVPGMAKIEVSAPTGQGVTPVTVRNVGLGPAIGVNIRCQNGSANVLSQPPQTMNAGQTVTVMVWRFADTKCRPNVTGANTNNLPLSSNQF
jgi:hypothetical protein